MPSVQTKASQFRRRILDRKHVLGTFVKFPSTHSIEILGLVGYDFVIVDCEHGAFNRESVDRACLAARAADIAAIVRVSEVNASAILGVLDCGATGVMAPHCDSPAKARELAAACRHRGGVRGFATTTRAGGYGGSGVEEHIKEQDANTTCIAMIEDHAALACLREIASIEGIDAFFLGRGDLTAALGVDGMNAAVREITTVAGEMNKPTIALVSSKADAREMRSFGVSAFLFSNDQNMMKTTAAQGLKDYGDPSGW